MMTQVSNYINRFPNAQQERLYYLVSDLLHCDFSGPSLTFLDYGCGTGEMSAAVLMLYKQAVGTLVDAQNFFSMPENADPAIQNRYSFVPFADVSRIRGEQYDLVLNTDVLEHIPKWKPFFRELCNHVKEGGYLYIQVPSNYTSPNYPVRSVLTQRVLGVINRNNPNLHVRHGLSCKHLFDVAAGMGFRAITCAEDYCVNDTVYCAFKPRTHALFQKQTARG